MDVVVTLCGDAAESYPLTPSSVRRVHWPLPYPARASGTEEDVLAVFRAVRGDIWSREAELLAGQG